MWKRGGQSSALERAQALLSGQRSRRRGGQSTQGSADKLQGTVGGSLKTRSAALTTHTVLSDLSDLSSLSSAPEHGADTMGSAAPEKNQRRSSDSMDVKPQSSLGGGGSRFLKKAPLPTTNNSQSPVSKSQHMPEPRYVSSSQRGSQTAALSRLAQIESRFLSRKQPQEQTRQGLKPAHNLTSDTGVSPPPEAVSQYLEASLPHSSSDQSLQGKRFLKKKAAVAVDNTNTAASESPNGPDAGVSVLSRAASAAVPLVGSETKSVRVVNGVNLESDEEDMRILLGDSLDSRDNSFLRAEKISSMKKVDKMLSKSSQRVHSTPPSTAVQPLSSSNTPPPRSPASPRHSSPFRFTGQPQAHFSPSALSPLPSPPCVSPSLSRRVNSPDMVGSPQHALSSMSGHGEVLSLEELFPVEPASEDLHSAISVVSSEDFKINVMTLDDLEPATLGFTEETPGKEREHNPPGSGFPNTHRELPSYKEKEQQQQQEEEEEEENMLDYQSDFESESRTEQNYSASQISEHLPGAGDKVEAVLEVKDETLDADMSHERTEHDYSSTFSDTRRSCMSRTSDSETSKSLSRSRDSRSSVSRGSWTSSHQLGRRAAARRVLKEAAVQTQHDTMTHTWLTGMATSGPALGLTYMNPTPVAAHTLSAETVQALSIHTPAVFVLNEMLKQQLAMTRQFIESSRHLHSSLMRSLEPPNYRYTTLDDTKEYIRKHRPPKQTMEEALKEVMQEMREHHCTACD